MLFANDYHDMRVHIDDTQSNAEYFCPYCGAPLTCKKGDIRHHHFAHKQNHLCMDTWEREHTYDISDWHNEWQSRFPKVNQEIKLSLGSTIHRADVLTGRTVIEFQHSIMPVQAFDDRNNFYFNLGYKVIWLFDISNSVIEGKVSSKRNKDGLTFTWQNPKKAFNSYDVKTGCIDLFFQISDSNENCIVRVLDVSEKGFEEFYTSDYMTKEAFLDYVGLRDETFPLPEIDDMTGNGNYQVFKTSFMVDLNKQQERAIQSVEGSVLLLAVPGSGKTTVLIDRLGYMVYVKNVKPDDILAITYNTRAAKEMQQRFTIKYGAEFAKKIDFRTINSLANWIYNDYCISTGHPTRKMIEGKEQRALFGKIYQQFNEDEYASDSDILQFGTYVSYTKNMMLGEDEVAEFDENYPQFSAMYAEYQKWLDDNSRMDFDDQMVYAYSILTKRPKYFIKWNHKYKYICVDEAQDTSKIQHCIIGLLAKDNNLFMVGDEDQSIYGFRAAYPKALLNFRVDYKNPYILRMERNYRSTPQIVQKAQLFISQNKGRYEKNMFSEREDGEPVSLIHVPSQEEQYNRVLDIARSEPSDTAILFRDNESSVVLVDLFKRNGIDFNLKKPEANFFEHKTVRDIVAYLSLSINDHDIDSFQQICNKGILYLKNQQKDYAVKACKYRKISVFDAVDEQMQYVKQSLKGRAKEFRRVFKAIALQNTETAITTIMEEGYESYLEEKHYESGKVRTLLMLAKQEPDKQKFLQRLIELETIMGQEISAKTPEHVTLSTIHSSKGLEYDSVYLIDVFDGRFPTTKKDLLSRSKDSANAEQEERRLFYVGITRAKNHLTLFSIDSYHSAYIDELFHEEKIAREKAEEEKRSAEIAAQMERKRQLIEQRKREYELRPKEEEQRRKEAEEKRRRIAEQQYVLHYVKMYDEVKDRFTQQEHIIRDSSGTRWIKCEKCGVIGLERNFVSYGGINHINLGICKSCSRK